METFTLKGSKRTDVANLGWLLKHRKDGVERAIITISERDQRLVVVLKTGVIFVAVFASLRICRLWAHSHLVKRGWVNEIREVGV